MIAMIRFLLLIVVFAVALGAQPRGILRPKIGKGRQARPMRQVEKFSRMTPEERKRVIERLPPERQKEVERNLESYQKLTPDDKQRLNKQLESFRNLPAEKQQRARRVYRDINQLPRERKLAIRREMAEMRTLTADERATRLDGDEFKNKFSEDERKMVRELTALMADETSPD